MLSYISLCPPPPLPSLSRSLDVISHLTPESWRELYSSEESSEDDTDASEDDDEADQGEGTGLLTTTRLKEADSFTSAGPVSSTAFEPYDEDEEEEEDDEDDDDEEESESESESSGSSGSEEV